MLDTKDNGYSWCCMTTCGTSGIHLEAHQLLKANRFMSSALNIASLSCWYSSARTGKLLLLYTVGSVARDLGCFGEVTRVSPTWTCAGHATSRIQGRQQY